MPPGGPANLHSAMTGRDFDFLVDAQLPSALAKAISDAGYTARHVSDVGLLHAADIPIWDYARAHGCTLITKDEDFVAIRLRATDGVTVVWLRVRNSSRRALLAWFMPRLPEIVALIDAGEPLIELR
jgi:predicted nuclease of predicted toxin-antitoxin system